MGDPVDAGKQGRFVHAGFRRAAEAEGDLRLEARLEQGGEIDGLGGVQRAQGGVVHVAPDRRIDPVFRPDGPVGEADLAADRPFTPVPAQPAERRRHPVGERQVQAGRAA